MRKQRLPVMPGLDPGIHDFAAPGKEDVDGRVSPAMTDGGAL
jgi:hypothetical protein